MPPLSQALYTPDQYLALERKAGDKAEYVDGRIVAMAVASVEHNTITANLVRTLGNQFVDRPSRLFSSDMRVKVAATGLYTYPDVVAVCGEMLFDDAQRDTLVNPTAIIEVLSPSTEAYDRGEKFAHYRRSGSLADYVLVSQDKARIEHYIRQEDHWVLTEISRLDDTLRLTTLGYEVTLREIYSKVEVGAHEGKVLAERPSCQGRF